MSVKHFDSFPPTNLGNTKYDCDETDTTSEDDESRRRDDNPLVVLFESHHTILKKVRFESAESDDTTTIEDDSISRETITTLNSLTITTETATTKTKKSKEGRKLGFFKTVSTRLIRTSSSRKKATKRKKKSGVSSTKHKKYEEGESGDVLELLETTSLLSMVSDTDTGIRKSGLPKHKKQDINDCIAKLDKKTRVLLQQGDDLNSELQYNEAINKYMSAMKRMKKSGLADDHPSVHHVVKRLNDVHHAIYLLKTSTKVLRMGCIDEESGHNLKALKYYSVAYRMRRDLLGEKHQSLAVILFMIARAQAKRGEYDESLQIYDLCQDLINLRVGPEIPAQYIEQDRHLFDAPTQPTALRDIGAVYERMGNFDKALECYNESLLMQTGHNHLEWANSKKSNSYDSQGHINMDSVQFDSTVSKVRSEEEEQQATEVFMRTPMYRFEKGDVDSAMTLHSIGQIQRRLGHYNMALQAYHCALNCIKSAMGENHPNVAAMLGNIGNLHKERGDNEKAFRIYQKVLRIEMAALGPNDPEIAVTLNNIAAIECCRGKHREAIGLLQRVLKVQRTAFGDRNIAVAATLNTVGEVNEKLHKIDEAITAYQDSIRILIHNYGRNNVEVARLLQQIAVLYFEKTDDLLMADIYCNRAAKMLENMVDSEEEYVEDDPALYQKCLRLMADIKAAIAVSRSDAWSVSSSESAGYSSV